MRECEKEIFHDSDKLSRDRKLCQCEDCNKFQMVIFLENVMKEENSHGFLLQKMLVEHSTEQKRIRIIPEAESW